MIRVLVIDDSAVVRKVLSEELSRYPDIQVVGTASDPYVAREKIAQLRPDVLTLDVEMPRMDGLSFLAKLMKHHPIPTIVVSSVTPKQSEAALRALQLGAIDVIAKPGSAFSVPEVGQQLVRSIRAAAQAKPRLAPAAAEPARERRQVSLSGVATTHRLIAIGASTGGTTAVEKVLRSFPVNAPGTLIVQHMPAGFTASFAKRLDQVCDIAVAEAKDGDLVATGRALIAPGGSHMVLESDGAQRVVKIRNGPPVHHQKPAVDVLFQSVARVAGRNAVGALLTGMGADGAAGLAAMREAGAFTVAQDETSCVVFGMPKEAIRLGAAQVVLPLSTIAEALLDPVSVLATL
jgi:two-component system, chemotaxis family, protein-glutamate methylesterase/glutaminase